MPKQHFREFYELEDHEIDRHYFIQGLLNTARGEKDEQEKEERKRRATKFRLYGPVKRAGRKRDWKKAGGETRRRDKKGRFV